MATRTVTLRISDISGKELADGEGQTVTFSVGSDTYEMDVTDKEAGEFYDTLKKYTDVATKKAGRGVRKSGGTSRASGETKKIKEWAAAQGLDFPQRGRLPQTLIDQYHAAN